MSKWIPGYKGLYSISDSGAIFSHYVPSSHKVARKKHPIKPRVLNSGYLYVDLHKENEAQRFLIHRLVLATFRGNAPVNCQAAHLDGKPTNNALSNLAWVTKEENESHKFVHGTAQIGERHASSKLTYDDIKELYRLRGLGCSQQEIANRLVVSRSTIEDVLQGRTWTHYRRKDLD